MSGNFPQEVKSDMGTNTIGNQNWKLTLIRDYTVSQQNEIEYAMFGYGRRHQNWKMKPEGLLISPQG